MSPLKIWVVVHHPQRQEVLLHIMMYDQEIFLLGHLLAMEHETFLSDEKIIIFLWQMTKTVIPVTIALNLCGTVVRRKTQNLFLQLLL